MKQAKSKPAGIVVFTPSTFALWEKKQDEATRTLLRLSAFSGGSGELAFIQGSASHPARVLAGAGNIINLWSIAHLPEKLTEGTYILSVDAISGYESELYLGWLLGSYRFTRYRKLSKTVPAKTLPELVPPDHVDVDAIQQMAESISLARDLINTPPNDMGPEELAAAVKKVALKYKAVYKEIKDKQLLVENYPAIYEVGKASARPPLLCDFSWGNVKHPKVTLVGKGVCFDTGGLDIKPSSGMKLMKKDMGGAACMLALAELIMQAKLPVRLRVLIPAVENSISGNAYRTSDVIKTRKGISVEVGNTDAEGRLILCDALFEADQEKPDLLIDCATLTGAARTALGTDIPALFTPSDTLASAIAPHCERTLDPLWRMPLWAPYRELLNSNIADINSAPDGPYAGAITAALYLKEFVTHTKQWAHIDMMAWNVSKRPGRPAGGEAMAIRALFSYLKEHFGK